MSRYYRSFDADGRAVLDGSMAGSIVGEMEEHVAGCRDCREALESWRRADMALSSVLGADAVPSRSLDQFVTACTRDRSERRGWTALAIEWISAPRRAIAATVAGSFAVTGTILLLAWVGSCIHIPMGSPVPTFRRANIDLMATAEHHIQGERNDL